MKQHAIVFLSVTLVACSSIGVRYEPPDASQDSAEILSDGGVHILTFSDEGCYVGRTLMEKSTRLHAGKVIVMSFESSPGRDRYCAVPFSFVPEKNAKYQLVTGITQKDFGNKTIFGNPDMATVCGVTVAKLDSEGTSTAIPLTSLKMQQVRFACIKASPK